MTPADTGKSQVFGIVGVGPVGSILAGHLAKHGQRVILVDILKDHLDTIKTKGLTVSGVNQIKVRIEDVCYSIPELKKHRVDAVFVCVKASVLPRIMKDLKESVTPSAYVISYQNGLDTEDFIAQELGKDRTLRCVVNYAGNMVGNGHVDMTFFNKPNYIGAVSQTAEDYAKAIADILTSSELDTKFAETIRRYTWEKTILNVGMMALCAVTRQTMKDSFDFEPTHRLIEELVKEGIEVAKKDGIDFGPDFFDFCMKYLGKGGRHKPSMSVDVENQRPTEINFLNGKVAEYGKKYGVPTPYNQAITAIVKAIEAGYKKP